MQKSITVLFCFLLILFFFFFPPAISPPSNLQFTQVGPTSFLMHWLAPGQENQITGPTSLTGYRVVVNPKNTSGPTKEINLAPDATQAHISGLMVNVNEIHLNLKLISVVLVFLIYFISIRLQQLMKSMFMH